MPLRTRTCLALLLAVAAAPAAAQPGIGTCVMGETRGPSFGNGGTFGYSVIIYQWMDPGGCLFCLQSGGAIQLRTVELLAFNGSPNERLVNATISVIGWSGSADCPVPDESVVLMPPQPITLHVPSGNVTVRAPIVASPTFVAPAFFKLAFTPVPVPISDLAFWQVFTCATPCRQYISASVPFDPPVVMAQACSIESPNLFYPWVVRPRGDCVAPVAVRTESWGRLKTFYK